MNCEERRDLILLDLLGVLDTAEQRDLRAHITGGCPRCIGSVAESEALLGQLALALPPVEPSADVNQRVLDRIRAVDTARPTPADPPSGESRRKRLLRLLATGAVVLIAAGMSAVTASWHMSQRMVVQADEIAEVRKSVNERKMHNSILEGELERAAMLTAALNARDLDLIPLAAESEAQSAESQGQPAWGRILWDRSNNRWHLQATGLSQLAGNVTYQLGAITEDDEQIVVGTFAIDRQGGATAVFDLPTDATSDIKAARVTTEPDGDVQLSGRVHL